MAARLTPLGLITKWALAPAVLAAVGYFAVGPSLGSDPKLRAKVSQLRRAVPDSITPVIAKPKRNESPDPDAESGPEVNVSVRPIATDVRPPEADIRPPEERKPRRRRRSRRRREAAPSAPPSADATPQDAATSP